MKDPDKEGGWGVDSGLVDLNIKGELLRKSKNW